MKLFLLTLTLFGVTSIAKAQDISVEKSTSGTGIVNPIVRTGSG